MKEIMILQPNDAHIHLRDNLYLERTVADAANQFARVIVMPNLKPPITTVTEALAYRKRILQISNLPQEFHPLMALYLTESTTPEIVTQVAENPFIVGFKYYPAGATTHSDAGVKNWQNIVSILEKMEQLKIPLLIHGEVTHPESDIFDREKIFIDQILIPMVKHFPTLKIVLEHISTKDAVDFIYECQSNIAATITAHHLLLNRNDLLVGGIKPHHYCLPIVKRKIHQDALIQAAISGLPKFFLGTDSAPHTQTNKENACGCAGIYTAHCAIELYAEIFEQMNALDRLENFASQFAAKFYGWPSNSKKILLRKEEWPIPECYQFGADYLIPFRANEMIQWKIIL